MSAQQSTSTSTAQPSDTERTPWQEEMDDLAAALRARGRDVPDAGRLTLVRVPEDERINGLPLYRIVIC